MSCPQKAISAPMGILPTSPKSTAPHGPPCPCVPPYLVGSLRGPSALGLGWSPATATSVGTRRGQDGQGVGVPEPPARGWRVPTGPWGGTARAGTWSIPAGTGGEEVPVDLAQELGQGAGEEGELDLVPDEVPGPAQETHQRLGVGVQLWGRSKRTTSLAPCRHGMPPLSPARHSPRALALSHRIASPGHGRSPQQGGRRRPGPGLPGRTPRRRSRGGCARGAAARGAAATGPAARSSSVPGCQGRLQGHRGCHKLLSPHPSPWGIPVAPLPTAVPCPSDTHSPSGG